MNSDLDAYFNTNYLDGLYTCKNEEFQKQMLELVQKMQREQEERHEDNDSCKFDDNYYQDLFNNLESGS